jgi:hypothetical protein
VKIAMNICGAIVLGILAISFMRSCAPFAYLETEDKDRVILKGGIER